MQMKSKPSDSDVPFFPYPLEISENGEEYHAINHLMSRHIRLDRQAAEVMRLADGARPLSEIIGCLSECYPDAGGQEAIRSELISLLRTMTSKGLVWWRQIPLRPVPVGPPANIFWEITAACNLRCLHCVVEAGKRDERELTTSRCLKLAEEFAALGVQSIAFSGGEPLMHPDFFTIARRVRELGMSIQLATNGTLVTHQIARALMDLEAQVQVSLDGSTAEIHNALRPGQNAFDRSIEGVRALVDAGHQVTIGTVLSSRNIDDIPSMVALTLQLGAPIFRLIPFIPKGRGQLNKDMEVPKERVREVIRYLRSMRGWRGLSIAPLEFEEMLDGGICPDSPSPDRPLKCGGAVAYATVTPIGEVLPCHFFEGVRADNVLNSDFRDIWYRSRFLNYFRHLRVSDLHGNCSTCTWLPRCAGSCRALSHAKGDVFGGNVACWV